MIQEKELSFFSLIAHLTYLECEVLKYSIISNDAATHSDNREIAADKSIDDHDDEACLELFAIFLLYCWLHFFNAKDEIHEIYRIKNLPCSR